MNIRNGRIVVGCGYDVQVGRYKDAMKKRICDGLMEKGQDAGKG